MLKIDKLFIKEKHYEFSLKGFEQAKKDYEKKVSDRKFEIAFWIVMFGLFGIGIVSYGGIIKITACNLTSKAVKFLIN